MQIVLEYYLDKKFSIEKLDELTSRKDKYYTWSTQFVSVLYELGLEIKDYTFDKIEPYYFHRKNHIIKKWGADADYILSVTDLSTFLPSVKKAMDNHLIIITVDWNFVYGISGSFDGHFIVLTGYDKNNFYYHESGPKYICPNKSISKEKLEFAANLDKECQEIIIIYGKRKN